MSANAERRAFERLADRLTPGARVVEVRRLEGGISARVDALTLRRSDGALERVVVRRHGPATLARNPGIAAEEFALLTRVAAAGIAAPRPRLRTPAGAPFATPALVVDFVEGASDAMPDDDAALPQLVAQLHALHAIDGDDSGLPPLPDATAAVAARLARPPDRLDDTLGEGALRTALARCWPPPPSDRRVLLHGDLWPGNTLWRRGRLAALIDWEDAQRGDPLADLANARLEWRWERGAAAAATLTSRYLEGAALDPSPLPCWDLAAALRPCGQLQLFSDDPRRLAALRSEHRAFVAAALAALARGPAGG